MTRSESVAGHTAPAARYPDIQAWGAEPDDLTNHDAGRHHQDAGRTTVTDPYFRDPIRRDVALRLSISGRRHVRHRLDRAGRPDRPGPHAIVLFFRPPQVDANPVVIATRMFLDGPDVTNLPDLLITLTERARDYGHVSLDVLVGNLCDRVESLHAISSYLGVGVSSIDVAREGVDPLPWDGIAHLIDGTRMSLRGSRSEIPPQIVSTHTLEEHEPRFVNSIWQWAATTTPAPADRPDLAAAHPLLANVNGYLYSCEDR